MSDPILIISSDGHATSLMPGFRGYLDPEYHEEFDAFCEDYAREGSWTSQPKALGHRTDPDIVDKWVHDMIEPGRIEGNFDPKRRLEEVEKEGIAAEVLIPDLGLPFELYTPAMAAALGKEPADDAHINAGKRAWNRWLVDYMSYAPERFGGMLNVSFDDVEEAMRQIRWAKEVGFRGVMMPLFDEAEPLFHERFDPIWSLLEDLDLPLCSHVTISSTSRRVFSFPAANAATHLPLRNSVNMFFVRNILDHLIWGGVLERHPKLRVAFTEQGSGWFPGKLAEMDYSYEGSYLRSDIHNVLKHKPSDYFRQSCWIGASLLSEAEMEFRDSIGVDKLMIGCDYPHHEGTWNGGNVNYLQATLGAAHVPEDDARKMLGFNIVDFYKFDKEKLTAVANRIGPTPERILTAPTEDLFPRGDVHKPLSGALF
jgi:predicted TIM-barrel fold metal-dependent hydrolase